MKTRLAGKRRRRLTVDHLSGFVVEKPELEATGFEEFGYLVDDQRVQTDGLVVVPRPGC